MSMAALRRPLACTAAVAAAYVGAKTLLKRYSSARLAAAAISHVVGTQLYHFLVRANILHHKLFQPTEKHAVVMYSTGPARVAVANGRDQTHTLDKDGFVLASLPELRPVLDGGQESELYSPRGLAELVYPNAESALRTQLPGATKVIVFDHIVRDGVRYRAEATAKERTEMLAQGPVFRVHGDYTARSGYTRARSLLAPHETEERIDAALAQRFAFVNVWVPLSDVHRDPLGVIEWASQQPTDVQTLKFIYSHRVGEIYNVPGGASRHRWTYFPQMTVGESLLFKMFDSDDSRARFCLHSAFVDPAAAPDAPERRSVELRTIVFFGDDAAVPADFARGFVAPHLVKGSADQDLNPKVELLPPTDEW